MVCRHKAKKTSREIREDQHGYKQPKVRNTREKWRCSFEPVAEEEGEKSIECNNGDSAVIYEQTDPSLSWSSRLDDLPLG